MEERPPPASIITEAPLAEAIAESRKMSLTTQALPLTEMEMAINNIVSFNEAFMKNGSPTVPPAAVLRNDGSKSAVCSPTLSAATTFVLDNSAPTFASGTAIQILAGTSFSTQNSTTQSAM